MDVPSPLPRDIPLPLPADHVVLQALLVMLFLVHILFVNLMVGGAVIGLMAEIAGRKRRDFDVLAHEIAQTITVNKSLAVVFGVGPLLAINVLYTVHFYSANALTGSGWLSVVPLVVAAFLAAYAHKYSWNRLSHAKGLHIALGALATLLFLSIPLIFLANINLMLFPERWLQVKGFFSAVLLPNVLPRYLHFVLASLAIASLFMLVYFTRRGYPVEDRFENLDRAALRRLFYSIALGASLAQLLVGPLVLFTLPRHGMSWFLLLVIGIGVSLGITAMVLMWREIVAPCMRPQRRLLAVFALITLTAFAMGYGRHVYRENAVSDHRRLMVERTREFGWAAGAASWREASGVAREETPLGEQIFTGTCAACHAVDRVLVGPSVTEIAELYASDPAGIAAWTRQPGRKREGFPPMPAFRLSENKLRAVADYMLQMTSRPEEATEVDSREG
jgi:cytochrome c